MNAALKGGLSTIAEFVPEFMAGHAGRVQVFTYGPEGGEPDIVSYEDFGGQDPNGSEAADWVAEGACIVIAITRRRRTDQAPAASDWSADAPRESDPASPPEAIGAADGAGVGNHLGRAAVLTHRESEVVGLIVRGLSNRDIADKCSLSINSVKSYIRSGYQKMDVTSRAEAVAWGAQHGFPREPDFS